MRACRPCTGMCYYADHYHSHSPLWSAFEADTWQPQGSAPDASATFSLLSPQWFKAPDYPIFGLFRSLRSRRPWQPFHLLHPRLQWQLWELVQEGAGEQVQRNPPSSGLLGKKDASPKHSRQRPPSSHPPACSWPA